jgi:SAM-dependent methyltransferase
VSRREGEDAPDNSNPRESHAGLLDPVRVAYDAVAEPYAAQFAHELDQKPVDRSLIDAFAQMCGATTVFPLVDVGCGPGHVTHYLSARGLPALGVDLSPGMVAVARRLYPTLEVLEGSILDLPLADSSCSGVLSLYSIIHLPRAVVPVALGEFHRVLRPDGVLLLGFHAGDQQLHLDEWLGREVSLDGYLFDPADIARELEAVGFIVEVRMDRRPYADIEIPTERAYLLARRQTVSN